MCCPNHVTIRAVSTFPSRSLEILEVLRTWGKTLETIEVIENHKKIWIYRRKSFDLSQNVPEILEFHIE